jgi:hypothetical protein
MSQVLKGPNARCAIEVTRTDTEALLVVLDTDCAVTLTSHPLVWAEIGAQYSNGKMFFEFDKVWHPLMRQGPAGIEPYPLFEATRKFIRGSFSEPVGFKAGSLDALADVLPHGDIHLFTREWGFIGRFAALEDAQMIAAALKAVKPIIFSTAQEFTGLATIDQGVVLTDLDPVRQWPAKITPKIAQGIIEMAKAKTKSKTKKVATAEAKQRRADGPVAKARGIFEQMKDKDSAEIIKACEAAGINRGTATTQLGRWRKENNIVVKRGGARKKPGEKSAEKKNESPKKDELPKSGKKGEKRHKPKPPASSSTTDPKKSKSSQAPDKTAASAPATSPATASSGSGTAAGASSSQVANGHGPASAVTTTAEPSERREPSPGPTPKK